MHKIGKLVARIHEASPKWLVGELAVVGLKSLAPSHGDVLAYLFMHGAATMHELADFAHRTRPTMTVLVDTMEAAGLVTRRTSESDARSHVVRLTERGGRTSRKPPSSANWRSSSRRTSARVSTRYTT